MILTNLWTLVILTLCLWNVGRGCTWMQKQKNSRSMFQNLNNKTISMLQRMGGGGDDGERLSRFTRDGILNFPSKQYNQASHLKAGDKLVFISHAFIDMEKLFSNGISNATSWAQRDVDKLMNDLFRQNNHLHQCVKEMRPTSNYINKKMKLHFKLMKKYVKKQGYEAGAWEEVRRVVLTHLQRLDVLAATV